MTSWFQQMRTLCTGLALLAMLALLCGQGTAAREVLLTRGEHAMHAKGPAAPKTQHSPHHAMGRSLACCGGGTCAVTPPVLASATGTRSDAQIAVRYFPGPLAQADGIDAGPAKPPPRCAL